MRAAVLNSTGEPFVIRDVNLAPPKEGEVLIRLAAAGVCHSDLSVTTGILPSPLPVILGHEGAGWVEAVGPRVTSVRAGDSVVLTFVPNCSVCRFCLTGRAALCERAVRLGGNLYDGTSRLSVKDQPINHFLGCSFFAEYAVVMESSVVKSPGNIPLEELCLLGCCITTGIGAVINRARVPIGASVAVFGCGGVGLSVIQGSVIAGAGRIVAVDLRDERLEKAIEMGATDTINASRVDSVTGIRQLIGREGVQYAFEAIGRPETIAQAFAATGRGGTTVVIGVTATDAVAEIPTRYFLQEKALLGSYYGSGTPREDILRLLALYERGGLKLAPLISHRWRLDEINEAFGALERGEGTRGIIIF